MHTFLHTFHLFYSMKKKLFESKEKNKGIVLMIIDEKTMDFYGR